MADPVAAAGDRVVVVQLGDDGLSRRGQMIAWALAVVVVLMAALGATWAGEPPLLGAGEPPADGHVDIGVLGCDTPTMHMSWTGETYNTVELSVVGDRVASPGDQVECTVEVTNTGPAAAVMTVTFTPVLESVGAANPDLATAITLFWAVDGTSTVQRFDADNTDAQVKVPCGATVPVRVGFVMPIEETQHYRAGGESTLLSFGVTIELQEDTDPPDGDGDGDGDGDAGGGDAGDGNGGAGDGDNGGGGDGGAGGGDAGDGNGGAGDGGAGDGGGDAGGDGGAGGNGGGAGDGTGGDAGDGNGGAGDGGAGAGAADPDHEATGDGAGERGDGGASDGTKPGSGKKGAGWRLGRTGAEVAAVAVVGAGLLVAGFFVVVVARRRDQARRTP
ncbi:MAG: hypothetical protein FWF21_03720 [Micrococcales bacterium]|nr:hypothetical protein [Micrococcales bacterium]